MTIRRILVANRGEIAVRIMRTAADLGIATVAVHPADDAGSLHVVTADTAVEIPGQGPAAYLDIAAVVAAALDAGCDAVHPGYGFLAERADFASAVTAAGLVFIGPEPAALALFGDKAAARRHAIALGVPVARGTDGPTDDATARAFLDDLGPGGALMVKALAGGGGRGMRVVRHADDLAEAMARCRSEALGAFGNGDLYVEELVEGARHIEVQVVGDGTGAVAALGERECSVQRQRQKLVEIAPAPGLDPVIRQALIDHAIALAAAIGYRSLATMEFLVAPRPGAGSDAAAAGPVAGVARDVTGPGTAGLVGGVDRGATGPDTAGPVGGFDPVGWTIVFCEGNARIQVEHTVTEEVFGIDLVEAQLRLADGATLADLDLPTTARGVAVQARVNLERIDTDGSVRPGGGVLSSFAPPAGPGVRVDVAMREGDTTNPRYDSMVAKVIAHHPSDDPVPALRRLRRALVEFALEGAPSTLALTAAIVEHPDVAAGNVHTRWLDEHLSDLLATAGDTGTAAPVTGEGSRGPASGAPGAGPAGGTGSVGAGAEVDRIDPLAVLSHGRDAALDLVTTVLSTGDGGRGHSGGTGDTAVPVGAPMQGTIVAVAVGVGDEVPAGATVAVMEAMKMEHEVTAPVAGVVVAVGVEPGMAVFEGHPIVAIEPGEVAAGAGAAAEAVDLDHIRPDLAEAIERHEIGLDHRRPDAVARRRRTGQRTARENLADLVDPGSYIEYGPLVIAPQRRRRTTEDLIANTPADGMIAGIGRVNGDLFGPDDSRCVVMSYDYTVLAGTQGGQNHRKKDRLFELAERWELPVVFFTEGGGGRPGDTDGMNVAGLDCLAFGLWAELSGLVPLVGINSGYCFAGNAALLGCCDVVIATENSHIAMGGPAMIEGGGLGVFRPTEIAPIEVQRRNGVVDIVVADEAEAVAVAKQYLSYFQGSIPSWEAADQRVLRSAVPENRLRVYDVRRVIDTVADIGSVLELRRDFGLGMVTVLARVEGRPVGIMANDPTHLAGAIDADAADKAARFMQLCDAFDLPIVQLCDTPGIMVGPEVEKTALVRHASRMFVTARSLTVPTCTIVLRKGYGLGAQAMASGGFKFPMFTVAWPTGEFGGMGLEGAVKLGYRKELEAVEDPAERRELFDQLVARMYAVGKGVSMADHFEIDDVIDPADSRRWITTAFGATPPPSKRRGRKRPMIDTW